ncbi:MAG: hypothetical protein KDA16_03805 [Phycisphaerales bacterium]|nr:hypothetical protein [Phycisphaerales bacterium]
MKEYISIPTLQSDCVTDELIDSLATILPEGVRNGRDASGKATRSFCMDSIIQDDPRVNAILDTLRKHGMRPRSLDTPDRPRNEFWIVIRRKYSRSDLLQSEFLKFNGLKYASELGWRTKPEGLVILPVRSLQRIIDSRSDTLYTDRPGWTVVSDRVKDLVEQSDLRHISFRPTVLVSGRGRPEDPMVSWSEVGAPWWEITSDYTMPPLSPTVEIVAQDGSPFVSYETQNLELREGSYEVPELHYRRSEIAEADWFDLALSHEHIGKPPHQQMKIASQRFYQFCSSHHIKASWMPVRIDDC